MKLLLKTFGVGLAAVWMTFAANAASELKWLTDLNAAQQKAKAEKKFVLLDFTGSDWCGWCIKLNKEVFSTKEFGDYANTNLVLVEVDFPRRKELSAQQQRANMELAQKYNIEGYPTIIVLDADGKPVWRGGYAPGGPKAWLAQLNVIKKK